MDVDSLNDATQILNKALNISWSREERARRMKVVYHEVQNKIYDWKDLSVPEMCYNVINSISEFLPQANMYTGILTNNGNTISYVACNATSSMGGKVLQRGQGVSFDVVDELKSRVLQDTDLDKRKLLTEAVFEPGEPRCEWYIEVDEKTKEQIKKRRWIYPKVRAPGALVNIKYGTCEYKANILYHTGHGYYTVRYVPQLFNMFSESDEAGVYIDRISPDQSLFKLKKFRMVGTSMPFVVVPLRNKDKGLGVLGVDSFDRVPIAFYESNPEPKLMQLLEKMGALIGATVDLQRKRAAARAISKVAKRLSITKEDLFRQVFEGMAQNISFLTGASAYRMIYERDEPRESRGPFLYAQYGSISPEALSFVNSFNIRRSNLKPVQQKMPTNWWIMCRMQPKEKGGQGKVYVITLELSKALLIPDKEFVELLQKLLQGMLQNLELQKNSDQIRLEALNRIKLICKKAHLYQDYDTLFAEMFSSLQVSFFHLNCYIGFPGFKAQTIKFVVASKGSSMKGKILTRDRPGVSFEVLETSNKMIRSADAERIEPRLRHFGPPERLEYPFLSLPLTAYQDSPIGVLCADGMDDLSGDSSASCDPFVTRHIRKQIF